MTRLALAVLTAAIAVAFAAAWDAQHRWPEWDERATDYDLEAT